LDVKFFIIPVTLGSTEGHPTINRTVIEVIFDKSKVTFNQMRHFITEIEEDIDSFFEDYVSIFISDDVSSFFNKDKTRNLITMVKITPINSQNKTVYSDLVIQVQNVFELVNSTKGK
jgi:hypothetical protein